MADIRTPIRPSKSLPVEHAGFEAAAAAASEVAATVW